jgi:basic membrane lipoprotein
MKIKRFMSLAAALSLSVVLASCGNDTSKKETKTNDNKAAVEENVDDTADKAKDKKDTEEGDKTPSEDAVSVTMVTDFGGINDKSFNQSTYEGLQRADKDGKATFDYIESHKEDDYVPNLESALDSESDVVLTVGYALFPATDEAADDNPEQNYVIIDNKNLNDRDNLLGVTFADHENSFLAGYIAGMTSNSNKVGFVGGQKSEVIDRFEYGYRAGVAQAAKDKDEDIDVIVQYANSYSDQAAGKNIANKMYQDGADVVFHAAGGVGIGVIEAAKENDKWVIGVDRDQSDEAPDNMLVSTVKGVDEAVNNVIDEYAKGNFKAGNEEFTLADGDAVTIAYPKTNDLVSKETKDKVEEIRKDIVDGKIKVPENEKEAIEQGWIKEDK